LNLPEVLKEVVENAEWHRARHWPHGLWQILHLAAILDKMNEDKAYHILTIEDPIEFLHRHKKSTIHQRELQHGHAQFCAGPARRSAPGPKSHSRGRNA